MFFSSFVEVVDDGSHSVELGIALESLGTAVFRRIDSTRRGVVVIVKTLPPTPLERSCYWRGRGGWYWVQVGRRWDSSMAMCPGSDCV